MLTALSIITGVLILGLAIGLIRNERGEGFEWAGSSIVLLLVVGTVGWLLLGNIFVVRSDLADITGVYVAKSPTTVYVEFDSIKYQFTTARDYNAINDSTKFQLKTDYNMYGGIIKKTIVIKRDELVKDKKN